MGWCISSVQVSGSSFPLLNHRNLKPNPKLGICTSLKWVPKKSPTISRNHGELFCARCDTQAERDDDRYYMRRCVEIARKAVGRTSPNPMVGCVIVKDSEVVGQGFHPKPGQPHAEVYALRDAGDLAEGATAYVSLEPCNHFGRTPPCTEALIKAKVKRVVAGMVDPNPIVASKGLDRLRDAGIDITVGVEEELCRRLNEAFVHNMLTGKPFVTIRYSVAVNGSFIGHLGEGVQEAGGYFSKLLEEYDAIIGSPTSSLLASQEAGANQPHQIVVARSPSLPILTAEAVSSITVFTDKEAALDPESAQSGVETVILDWINLDAILQYCKHRGLCSVLLDLRGNLGDLKELLKEGIEQNLLQKIVVEVLPIWGGDEGRRSSLLDFADRGRKLEVKNLSSRTSGQSIVIEGYL